MIRATVCDGDIQLIDPLPDGWVNGQELFVEAAEPKVVEDDLDAWLAELNELAAQIPPEDFERLDRALKEADVIAKEQVRKEMGLD